MCQYLSHHSQFHFGIHKIGGHTFILHIILISTQHTDRSRLRNKDMYVMEVDLLWLMTSYDNMNSLRPAQAMTCVAWRQCAITWTSVNLSWMGFCGIHLTPMSLEVLEISIRKMSLENTLVKLVPYLSRTKEVTCVWQVYFSVKSAQ